MEASSFMPVFLIIITTTLTFCPPVEAYNFVFLCTLNNASHFLAGAEIGKQLTQKGHTATFLLSEAYADTAERSEFSMLNFEFWKLNTTKEKWDGLLDEIQTTALEKSVFEAIGQVGPRLSKILDDECHTIFDDSGLMQRLKKRKIDMAIVDPSFVCSTLLGDFLNIPFISLTPLTFTPWTAPYMGIPMNPSYIPADFVTFSATMTFKERIINVLFDSVFSLMELASRNEVGGFEVSYRRAFRKSKLVLYNFDFAVEFPVPVPPNVIPVGGLTIQEAKPLSEDLERFMQSSGASGVVVVSLGTFFQKYSDKLLIKFTTAFAKLTQKILWKYDGPPIPNLSKNVRTMKWLPLNDLLGHPQTKAIVYQAGNNGLYEAVYHGTPIVALPIWADQMNVAGKVKARGIGDFLFIGEATSDDLVWTIMDVVTNPKYKENIQKLSAILHDRPMKPVQRAVYWIEHTMKFGGDVYRPASLDLSSIVYHRIDVYSVFLVILLLVLFVVYQVCKFLLRCCCGSCRGRARVDESKKRR